jgi:hypothetical protein
MQKLKDWYILIAAAVVILGGLFWASGGPQTQPAALVTAAIPAGNTAPTQSPAAVPPVPMAHETPASAPTAPAPAAQPEKPPTVVAAPAAPPAPVPPAPNPSPAPPAIK